MTIVSRDKCARSSWPSDDAIVLQYGIRHWKMASGCWIGGTGCVTMVTSCVVWTVDTADAVVRWHTYHKGIESIHPPYIQSLSAREVKKNCVFTETKLGLCAKNVFLTFWTYLSLIELIFHCNQISANKSCMVGYIFLFENFIYYFLTQNYIIGSFNMMRIQIVI